MKPFNLLAVGALAVALVPALAMAASLDLGTSAQTTSTVGVSVGSGTGVDVNAGTDVNVGTSAGSNGSNTGSSTNSASGSATGTAGINGMLMITQQDAADLSDTANGSAMITSSDKVATDADFAAYAKSAMRSDANLKEVDTDSGSIMVKYAEQGHLFGVFPVTMNASAKVSADGNVNFSYPWYRFMVSTVNDDALLRSSLATSAGTVLKQQPSKASMGATSTAAMSATLSASQKAQLLENMRRVLASSLKASASASASGTASTSSY